LDPRKPARGVRQGRRGFTLIELLVVVVLIAIASAVASLALRDPAATQLEHEAARLVALFEAARSEARASGIAVLWEPRGDPEQNTEFRFVGLPASLELPARWLGSGVSAQVIGAPAVVLGPEPLIGAQRVVLRLEARSLALATDGLGPFVVTDESSATP